MEKISKIKKIIAWIGVAFFGILIFGGGFSAVPFALLVLDILPIQKWQEFKRNKLKLNTALSIIIGVVLFIIAMLTFPTDENSKEPSEDSSSSTIVTTIAEEPTTAIATEEDSKDTTTTTVTVWRSTAYQDVSHRLSIPMRILQ